MKHLNITIIIAAALIAAGLHSLGRGIAEMKLPKEMKVEHQIQFDTNDPFPKQLDLNLKIQGQGSPALHIRVDGDH